MLRQRGQVAYPIEPEQWAEHFQKIIAELEVAPLSIYDEIKPPDVLGSRINSLHEPI